MADDTTLATCPFCGASAIKERIHSLSWHDRYGCKGCNVWFGSAAQWNGRAAQSQAEPVAQGLTDEQARKVSKALYNAREFAACFGGAKADAVEVECHEAIKLVRALYTARPAQADEGA
jgi:hypothetical protein